MNNTIAALASMDAARTFPVNTCPVSRHAAQIAHGLAQYGGDYHEIHDSADHCAESIAATVAALWEARTELARLKAKG